MWVSRGRCRERRTEAAPLLAALNDPRREWDAVVVGDGTRCWFGNQFSLIAPRFAAYAGWICGCRREFERRCTRRWPTKGCIRADQRHMGMS
jgi:hypothetical protein